MSQLNETSTSRGAVDTKAQLHVTCPKCNGVSCAPCDTVVACPFCEQHMRTPASAQTLGYSQRPYEPQSTTLKAEEPPVLKFIDNCKDFTKGAYIGVKGAFSNKAEKVSNMVNSKEPAEPQAVADTADPQTAAEIKELLAPHFAAWEIEAALKANNNNKVAAIKALIGVKPDENVQYYVPNHPPQYYQPQPEMGMAGGDRPRSFPGAKSWWEENTDQFGFKSGLLIGGLAGVTTGLIIGGGF
eukprot:CAMPEP_0118924368 /NCGR_PEP_ID=MMETSP1169-20130426/2534_1 /TAXON_ID=36882 /ORGANISM="Pyramimonas obovata, Strain CCMP722" /LENGTH=241 /DNA_ID=CAMNT_0006865471 /DNA_START=149 /DNA_END=874 /DNA_ORIENTATION=-